MSVAKAFATVGCWAELGTSAFNKRVVRGRVASPGEVLVVVLVALVVAF